MCEDLADRPFVRSRTLAQFGRWQALDYPLEFLCCSSLNRQRLLSFDVGCYPLNVLLCCFVHCVRLSPLCEYGTRGRHWGSRVSERSWQGQRTAKGTSGLSESCGQSESVASDRWSVPGTQFSVLS